MSAPQAPVLVLNSGSSSVKYQLLVPSTGEVLASGLVEKIGEPGGVLRHRRADQEFTVERSVADHADALLGVRTLFDDHGPDLASAGVVAVGHRVVHGGPVFSEPVIIDEAVIAQIEELSPLAPLHNPPTLAGIRGAMKLLPDVPHFAVFDTAFFSTLPAAASTYAIPADLAAEYDIRKYGFHGTSHRYVSQTVVETFGIDPESNQIVLHLGNGCSASAIRGGKAVDTSMGLTPLQGLVMGTRSGDVDPGLHAFLHTKLGLSMADIDQLLNKESGLKGLAGVNDFRELEQRRAAGDQSAQLAFDVYVHRLKSYIGAYLAILGRVSVLTFTAGVGENNPALRAAVAAGLEPLGIEIDPVLNEERRSDARVISPHLGSGSTFVAVVPTNEELAIARAAMALI